MTIQWAFEDWALGEMAKAMGKLKDYNYYRNRSLGWPASWHPDLRLMMHRKETGEWVHLDPLSERGFVQPMLGRLLLDYLMTLKDWLV